MIYVLGAESVRERNEMPGAEEGGEGEAHREMTRVVYSISNRISENVL